MTKEKRISPEGENEAKPAEDELLADEMMVQTLQAPVNACEQSIQEAENAVSKAVQDMAH